MAGTAISKCVATEGLSLKERIDVFEQAAEQRRAQLLRMARRLTDSSEDSEDIVQDAFVKAYQALPRFRGEAQMSTWLTAIVQNTALEYLRSRRGRMFVSIEYVGKDGSELVVHDFADARETPEQSCERRERESLLRGELGKLNQGCRRAIELCMLDGHSQASAAERMNVRAETVKSRVFYGKQILHRVLARRLALGKRRKNVGAPNQRVANQMLA
jgi:RNA polymerase sigma-70 factor, ECF subfamily